MWTDEMYDDLKIYFVDKSKDFLEEYFGKSFSNIEKTAKKLKISRQYSSFKWSDKQCEELKIYFVDKSKDFLEKCFNKSYDTIRKKANSLKIIRCYKDENKPKRKYKRKYIDFEYVKFLNNDINEKSIIDIAKMLNISDTILHIRLKEIGYKYKVHRYKHCKKRGEYLTPRRKIYSEDVNYFENIDSEEKSYFLGFIFADGYIHKHYKSKGGYIGIHIHKNDIEILEMFKKSIKSTGVIYTHGDYSIIRIHNKKLVSDIEKLGCVERKSLILDFPLIDDLYLHHFMRGYFDGDGSIRYSGGKIRKCQCGITSSHIFIEKYMNILVEKCNINKIKTYNRDNCYCFDYSGRGNCTKIYNFLYKDATTFLKRKKDKFEEVIYK